MHGLRIPFALLAFLVLCQRADAQRLVPADPWEVIHIARETGEAEVGRDKLRDPVIRATHDGVAYRIDFYGCRLGRTCDTILFRARLHSEEWEDDHPEIDLIDDWNASKLFGRAILSDSGAAILEHPVAIGPGLPPDALRASFKAWLKALDEFAYHVDFK